MHFRNLFTSVATIYVVASLTSVALAEPLTIEKAQELSQLTGRPILAVAGTKT
jgi:hypothetical protein